VVRFVATICQRSENCTNGQDRFPPVVLELLRDIKESLDRAELLHKLAEHGTGWVEGEGWRWVGEARRTGWQDVVILPGPGAACCALRSLWRWWADICRSCSKSRGWMEGSSIIAGKAC